MKTNQTVRFLTKTSATIVAFVLTIASVNAYWSQNTFAAEYGIVIENGESIYVYNDGSMIPDKYNTGINPNIPLTKVQPAGEQEVFEVANGFKMLRGSEGWYGADKLILDFQYLPAGTNTVTIENIDFSDYGVEFLDNRQWGETNSGKVIFKNCKFSYLNGARLHKEGLKLEFYDCEFNSISGSYMKFYRCQLHPISGDASDPVSDYEMYDSYVFIKPSSAMGSGHIDGFQTFGKPNDDSVDVENVILSNVRIELPKVKVKADDSNEWFIPAVNAPLMISDEYALDAHDITIENLHINGGGYSIYYGCSRNCLNMHDVTFRNIEIGYGHMFGILYPTHGNTDDSTIIYENVDHGTTAYIGSAWKSSTGVHMSVTNEMLDERTMTCVADGVSSNYTIPAHPRIIQHMDTEDVPEFSDLPYDLDYTVASAAAREVSCYDTTTDTNLTTAPLLKSVRFNADVNNSNNSFNGQGANNGASSNTTILTNATSNSSAAQAALAEKCETNPDDPECTLPETGAHSFAAVAIIAGVVVMLLLYATAALSTISKKKI